MVRYLFGIALILLVGWLILREEPINQFEPNLKNLSGQPLPGVSKGELDSISELERSAHLSFIDKLTKAEVEPIDGTFDSSNLANPIAYHGFFPPKGPSLEGVGDLVFQYRLPGGVSDALQQVNIPSTFNPSEELEIPWTANLFPKMVDYSTGEILDEASFSWLLLDQSWVQEVEMSSPPPERFCPNQGAFLFINAMERDQLPVNWQALKAADAPHQQQLRFLPIGPILLKSYAPSHGTYLSLVSLSPGEEAEWIITAKPRPRLQGILFGPDGQVMPNEMVRLLVEVESLGSNYDWEQGEPGFGTIVGGLPGLYRRTLTYQMKTNSKGEYSVVMPVGVQYAVEYSGRNSYGFATSGNTNANPDTTIQLNLHCQDADSGFPILLQSPSGEPIPNVFVNISIVDDFPWFRQFPALTSNQDGRIQAPWLQPDQGMRVMLIVRALQTGEELFRTAYLDVRGDSLTVEQMAD